jgi:hypothetical protein
MTTIDEHFLPYEYQFSSQHREDGIIDLLCSHIRDPDHQAIEIGSGTGEQNMIRNLVENRGYHGVGHDLRPAAWSHPDYEHRNCTVSIDHMGSLIESWPTRTPDFFSLDIDSFDYEVASTLLKSGFRPATVCCEINRHFGNDWGSFPYIENAAKHTYNRKYYYGCSLSKYKHLWSQYGYEFFTFDTRAVNAFWIHKDRVNIDLTVPRNCTLDTVDTSIIKQQIANHQFWKDHQPDIYKDFK